MEKTDGTIIEFINGSHSYDGVWFGEPYPDTASKYWWRPILKEYLAGLEKSTSIVQGYSREDIKKHCINFMVWAKGNRELATDNYKIYEHYEFPEIASPPSVPLSNKDDIEKMAEALIPIIDKQTFYKGSNGSYGAYVKERETFRHWFIAGYKSASNNNTDGIK